MLKVQTPVPGRPQNADGQLKAVRGIASDVVLDSRAREAIKRYRRQPAISALYRLVFQAPFPYVSNLAALKAAKYRRRIAGLITKYALGQDVIAGVKRVEEVDGGYVFVSELIDGAEPNDHKRAREFLHRVTNVFIHAGLPTWQVSPYNPRSLGNVMETTDGEYRIIDLESNVVTPMVPVTELLGAARTGHLPPFDDVDLPRLIRYVSDNWDDIHRKLGEADARELSRSIARYAWYENLWQKEEPRIWSRGLRKVVSIFDLPRHLRSLARVVSGWGASGTQTAERWAEAGVNRWEKEGLIGKEQADIARADLESGPIVAVLGHLGAQLAMSIPLRFPLGSIARFLWAGAFRIRAELRALLHRATPEETRTARGIHSTMVIAVSAVPGLGAAAYVLARPLRKSPVLLGAVLDQGFRMLPLHGYERLHLRPVAVDIARQNGADEEGLRELIRRIPPAIASLWPHRGLLAAVLGFNALAVGLGAVYFASTGELSAFDKYGLITVLMIGQALASGGLGYLYFRGFWSRPGGEERPGAAGTLFWLGGGAALVWLAIDHFFRVRQAIGGALEDVPLLRYTDDLVMASYLVAGIVLMRIFGHEVRTYGPTLALFSSALLTAGFTVAVDALVEAGSDWMALEQTGQLMTVALLLPAFILKYRGLRAGMW